MLPSLVNRAVGRSENSGVPVLFGRHNLPPLVEIGLNDLPKSGCAKAPRHPEGRQAWKVMPTQIKNNLEPRQLQGKTFNFDQLWSVLLLVCRIRGQTYCKKGKKGYNFDEWGRDFFLPLRKFPRIQLNYHLGCNQNLELCSSTVLCSAKRSRYDGSTLNPRYQVRTCTAHYSVLNFRWQFCVQPKITLGQDKCEKCETSLTWL